MDKAKSEEKAAVKQEMIEKLQREIDDLSDVTNHIELWKAARGKDREKWIK